MLVEKGYNALPGVMAQDITTWSEMKQVVRELKKPEVKEMYSTICIDTVDVAASLCDKYVCSQNDVDHVSQIPYGGGWSLLKKEFEEVFRSITQMGYAVYFISHSKDKVFKREDGSEYNQIIPSVTNTFNAIIENMVDLYGYMHPVRTERGTEIRITFRSSDGSIAAGGRFKYIAPEITSNYESLVKALNDAIDKEASETGGQYVTNEKNQVTLPTINKTFSELIAEFQDTVNTILSTKGQDIAPAITAIVEKYLGKGKKVSECNERQYEIVEFVVNELKTLL